jgi:hypothetical protein
MSRSPAIAAGALALFTGNAPEARLRLVTLHGTGDVSPAFWRDVVLALAKAELH